MEEKLAGVVVILSRCSVLCTQKSRQLHALPSTPSMPPESAIDARLGCFLSRHDFPTLLLSRDELHLDVSG